MPSRILPLILFLLFLAQTSFAQNAEIPFSGGRPQVEYKQTGNTYQWKPVTGKMPSQGVVFGSGHGVSNAEPKINTQGKLPYSTKPGSSPGPLKVSSKISPQKFGKVAGDILKGAITGAAGGGKVGAALSIAGVACSYYCQDLKDLLTPSDITHYRLNEDGSVDLLSKSSDDSDFIPSIGKSYSYQFNASGRSYSDTSYSPSALCSSFGSVWVYATGYHSLESSVITSDGPVQAACKIGYKVYSSSNIVYATHYLHKTSDSSCPVGYRVQLSTGKCFEPADDRYTVKSWQELDSLFGGYAANINLWNGSRAPHLAANLAPKYDILDDTQPVDVTGPVSAPISETVTRESVNLSPGTNTPVSPGHTGPTDSGTRTTTKTTTAQNSYSGDTMTTTTVTTTTTNITNNITNNTTNVGTSTEETDKAPEKEKPTCEENPDSLECAELDTPEGEIPRDEIQITFAPVDLGLGSGSCPNDRFLGPGLVYSYAPTCGMLSSYGRYLVWLLSSFSAIGIIFTGRSEV